MNGHNWIKHASTNGIDLIKVSSLAIMCVYCFIHASVFSECRVGCIISTIIFIRPFNIKVKESFLSAEHHST